MTDEDDAIEALTNLGLTGYEAKVFIGLVRLGAGTAREIDRITDVPRSQVYSAAEGLEARGLVDVQQSNPIRYRPVSLEEARSRLTRQLENDRETAISFLEDVERDRGDSGEEPEEIWTVRGHEAVSDRVEQLVKNAERRVVYGARSTDLVPETVATALREQSHSDVQVIVASESPEVRELFVDDENIFVTAPPEKAPPREQAGRVLLVDSRRVLISVLGEEKELAGISRETAFWSADSGFATVLVRIIESEILHESGAAADEI